MVAAQTERRVGPLVGGERREGTAAVAVTDQTTEGAFATVGTGDAETLASAVEAAGDALPTGRGTSPRERATRCDAIAAAIRERESTLADALVREAGVPIASARSEVAVAAAQFERVAGALRDLTGKHLTWTDARGAADNALVTAAPLGVVRCRPNARAPLATAALQVAPAVGAGNGVVLTPPAETPVAASILTEVVAGVVPTGAVGFVPGVGDDPQPGTAVDAVLDARPSAGVTQFRRRLGGGATTLVFPSADLDAATEAITLGGPSAVARRLAGPGRVLAHQSVQADLVDRVAARVDSWTAGDLFDEATTVAPLRGGEQAARLAAAVDDAVTNGATLVRGGEVDGRTVEPTVLADVPSDATVLSDGRAGPVVSVTPFESEGDALSTAADAGPSGTVRVFTDRHSLAMDVADAVDAGTVKMGEEAAIDDPQVGLGGQRVEDVLTGLTRTKRVVQ